MLRRPSLVATIRAGGYLLAVVLGVSFLSFSLFTLAPGDPAAILLSIHHETPTQQQIDELSRELHLDQPLQHRYVHWLVQVMQGDFGRSWRNGEKVVQILSERLPATLELALAAWLLLVFFTLSSGLLGLICQNHRGVDEGLRIVSILFMSLPNYWLGFFLVYFFALQLGWLPVMGRGGFAHLALPSITLALASAAMQGRILRANLLEVISQEHVRFAIARGLGPWTVLRRHVLHNVLGPTVGLWCISLGSMLGGAAVVESVFSWPGIGRLLVEAVLSRDIPVIQGVVLFAGLVVAASNMFGDFLRKKMDPRLEQAHGEK